MISGRYAQLDLWAHPTRAVITDARRLLRFVGCTPLAGREWAYLSQGERQRVLIARALMARPRLMILDEPCAQASTRVAREEFLGISIERLAPPEAAVPRWSSSRIMWRRSPRPSPTPLSCAGLAAVYPGLGPEEEPITSRTLTGSLPERRLRGRDRVKRGRYRLAKVSGPQADRHAQ